MTTHNNKDAERQSRSGRKSAPHRQTSSRRPPKQSRHQGLRLTKIKIEELGEENNLLQSGFWGRFKASAAWTAHAYSWDYQGESGRFLLLERRILRLFPMAYIPYGPSLSADLNESFRNRFLLSLAVELKKNLSPGTFFIRFDLDCEALPGGLEPPLRVSPYRVQPQDTVILGLEADKDTLLANMHKKTRYNIRLSAKKGVEIRRYDSQDALMMLDSWYDLYRETALRDGISLHSLSYYKRLFKLSGTYEGLRPHLYLYMAIHEEDNLAGIIVAHWDERATYMYGASGGHKRALMPNHLLQWAAIQDAADEGCEEYDFFGIPPADNPSHPMHGLWRFKTGFGGRIVHYQGAWDYAYSPLLYMFYGLAERFRGYMAALRKNR